MIGSPVIAEGESDETIGSDDKASSRLDGMTWHDVYRSELAVFYI